MQREESPPSFLLCTGSGDAVKVTINPPAASFNGFDLPVGTYRVSVTVSNCAGTATSSLVTVSDAEALDPTIVSCGQLPANGVLDIPKGASAPTVYKPAYTKANGCPVSLVPSDVFCQSCFLGSDGVAEGGLDKCDSSLTAAGVSIGPGQVGRVKWTVRASDQAGHTSARVCAICAEQVAGPGAGPLQALGSGKCPNPFDATTPCVAGKY